MSSTNSKWHGIGLVASGAIGAGMFSLPIVASGMWYGWAILGLIFIWLLNLWVALILVETNLRFTAGASFSTMVQQVLGRNWNIVNNIAVAFVMYILMYAYFSAAGSISGNVLDRWIDSSARPHQYLISLSDNQPLLGLAFGALIMATIWWSTSLVSRICLLLLIAMAISFSLSTSGLLLQAELQKLFLADSQNRGLWLFIWAALPYFVTSFACSGLVPSLVKFYDHNQAKIIGSLVWGTLISLFVYLLWITANFGNIGREEMAPIITSGGNMGDLSHALQSKATSTTLSQTLGLFSNFAITTSFLSIGVGLFDYIADTFKFTDSNYGRFKTALITFLPPATFSFFYPKGFILAIGYAGLVVLFSFYIVPILMSLKLGPRTASSNYFLSRRPALLAGLWISLLLVMCKLMSTAKFLPVYP